MKGSEMMKAGRLFTFVGALMMVIGVMLPWVTVSSVFGTAPVVVGYATDGLFAGAIGWLILTNSLASKELAGRAYSGASVFLALVAGGITLSVLVRLFMALMDFGSVSISELSGSIGVGLWIMLLGTYIVLIGAANAEPVEVEKIPPPPVWFAREEWDRATGESKFVEIPVERINDL